MGAVARRPGPYFRGAGAVLGHTASFLVSSESNVRQWGPWPQARSVPQSPAVWLWRRRRFGSDSYNFLVGSESDVRHWGPWPAGPVRPLRALLFWCGGGAVCEAFGGWRTA